MYGNGFCQSGFALGMGHGPGMLIVLMLVLVAVAIIFDRGRNTRPVHAVDRVDEAVELLRRRYAAGELSEEEFKIMKIKLQT